MSGSIGGGGVSFLPPGANIDGSAAAPSFAFASSPTTGFFQSAIGSIGIANLGVFRAAFDSNGTQRFGLSSAGGGQSLQVIPVANQVNYLQVAGGATTKSPALAAQGADINVALALVPKGTGALQAGTNDGTAAGGNARGANAVDWQTARTIAAQVASGAFSVILGGQANVASGVYDIAGGQACTASGGATLAVGSGSIASGLFSWALGSMADTRFQQGRASWASGFFATNGDAQAGELVLRGATTNATPLTLTADALAASTNNQLILANNSVAAVRISIAARETATGAGKAIWDGVLMVRRDSVAGATFVTGGFSATAPTLAAGTTAGWVVTTSADTTNGGLAVTVTGAAATAIHWVARVSLVEVT